MKITIENDEKVYLAHVSLREAVGYLSTLIANRQDSFYRVVVGDDICFWSGSQRCFYFTPDQGSLSHLFEDKKFKKSLKKALGGHLKSLERKQI